MPADTISKGAAVTPPTAAQMNISQGTTKLSSAAPSPLFSRRSSSTETGDFAVIPPSHPSRTFVLIFYSGDGLGHKYACSHSNVVKFFDLLNRNHDQQRVYKRVECRHWQLNPLDPFHWLDKLGNFIDKNVEDTISCDVVDAYRHLAQYCLSGSHIMANLVVGFSRGAYTARALAETLIHKVGLLQRCGYSDARFAYKLYVQEVDDDWHKSFTKFKVRLKPMAHVHIDFVGVWDTASSVGDVIPRTLPFTRLNTSIRVFRHALALHEPRASLHPKFYEGCGTDQATSLSLTAVAIATGCMNLLRHWSQQFDARNCQDGADVQEVWFVGSHCDIGGCAVPEDSPHSLGRIPLRWMVRECFRANTGIQFHAEGLRNIGLDPASLYPIVEDRPRPLQPRYHHFNDIAPRVPMASEEEHDVRDALSPMHDQFNVFALLWWILGFLPIWRHIPLVLHPFAISSRGMNLLRGLVVPKDHSRRFYVHPTVHTRMQAKEGSLD
ncbi:hypothetical protein LXA43DRAFT_1008636 [Ganoderma leucocontextum]|nr:hypothetical protein LXA43DRAFT_1008636 [Ganoderma leucocontextum]